ncbi:MAG: 6-pyruvoyl trahydropterin synthase family protein [Thermoguttaceae bacterium]
MKHSIKLTSDALCFAASHFITFGEPEKVEALHGHNFRVCCEITGPLNKRAYIVDFLLAFDTLKKICETLSHKVLLPRDHPYIQLTRQENTVLVSMPPLQWAFPVDDMKVLPIKNTTTEALAEYITKKYRKHLEDEHAFESDSSFYSIRMELEESPGLWAVCIDDGQ